MCLCKTPPLLTSPSSQLFVQYSARTYSCTSLTKHPPLLQTPAKSQSAAFFSKPAGDISCNICMHPMHFLQLPRSYSRRILQHREVQNCAISTRARSLLYQFTCSVPATHGLRKTCGRVWARNIFLAIKILAPFPAAR